MADIVRWLKQDKDSEERFASACTADMMHSTMTEREYTLPLFNWLF